MATKEDLVLKDWCGDTIRFTRVRGQLFIEATNKEVKVLIHLEREEEIAKLREFLAREAREIEAVAHAIPSGTGPNAAIDAITYAMSQVAELRNAENATAPDHVAWQRLDSARRVLLAKYAPITGQEHQGK